MHEIIGLIGSFSFAVCSWPLAYDCYKHNSAAGIKWSFIIIWFIAALFSSIYAIAIRKYILLPNYISGGLGICLIFYIKAKEVWDIKHHVD